MNINPITIMMLDDSKADVALTRRLFEEDQVLVDIKDFTDPEAAMQFLRETNVKLLIVDMNMLAIDGLDFIEEARAEGLIGERPVVMFSGVEPSMQDDLRATGLGVEAWVTKPMNFNKLHRLVKTIPELKLAVIEVLEAQA